jgi:phosphatidate cytidylyltransferase
MGDTGAYFGGRFFGTRWFGSRPFAPEISPKKTWEGSLVGLGFSLLAAIVTHLIYDEAFGSWALIVAVGILGGISAQLGDLVESGFKRFAGVKDSGSLIPGHGGFLDRVDGTFFCGPMIWVLLRMFGGN